MYLQDLKKVIQDGDFEKLKQVSPNQIKTVRTFIDILCSPEQAAKAHSILDKVEGRIQVGDQTATEVQITDNTAVDGDGKDSVGSTTNDPLSNTINENPAPVDTGHKDQVGSLLKDLEKSVNERSSQSANNFVDVITKSEQFLRNNAKTVGQVATAAVGTAATVTIGAALTKWIRGQKDGKVDLNDDKNNDRPIDITVGGELVSFDENSETVISPLFEAVEVEVIRAKLSELNYTEGCIVKRRNGYGDAIVYQIKDGLFRPVLRLEM